MGYERGQYLNFVYSCADALYLLLVELLVPPFELLVSLLLTCYHLVKLSTVVS